MSWTNSGSRRATRSERNKEIKGVFSAIADLNGRWYLEGGGRSAVLNFAPLRNGLDKLQRSTEHYERAVQKLALDKKPLAGVNRSLAQVERALTLPDGLPGRPWFKHQIYAPGMYTGYGVKTIPGVREAIEQKNWKQADEQCLRAGKVLENEAAAIEEIAAELEK